MRLCSRRDSSRHAPRLSSSSEAKDLVGRLLKNDTAGTHLGEICTLVSSAQKNLKIFLNFFQKVRLSETRRYCMRLGSHAIIWVQRTKGAVATARKSLTIHAKEEPGCPNETARSD